MTAVLYMCSHIIRLLGDGHAGHTVRACLTSSTSKYIIRFISVLDNKLNYICSMGRFYVLSIYY